MFPSAVAYSALFLDLSHIEQQRLASLYTLMVRGKTLSGTIQYK